MALFNVKQQLRPQASQIGETDREILPATANMSSDPINSEATTAGSTDAPYSSKEGFSLKNQLSNVLDNK